jgi:hypothetical protein
MMDLRVDSGAAGEEVGEEPQEVLQMREAEGDELATIDRLAAEFITELQSRGFQYSQIANVLAARAINLAISCKDPGAFALVIEAALREMNSQRQRQDTVPLGLAIES